MEALNVVLTSHHIVNSYILSRGELTFIGAEVARAADIPFIPGISTVRRTYEMITSSQYYSTREEWEQELACSYPAFLAFLDGDYRKAQEMFAVYAYKLLDHRPPKPLRIADPVTRKDLIQEVILHFLEDECKVLKVYEDQGKPFRNYFCIVALNKLNSLTRPRALAQLTDRIQ